MSILKWLFGSKENISKDAIMHSSIGDWVGDRKERLKAGGHGQKNIDYMNRNGIKYNISKTYSNGVRVGNIPNHKNRNKQFGENQSWFPKGWNEDKIKRAGQVVAHGKKLSDGQTKVGYYGNVKLGIIRTNKKVATIFPLSKQTNRKGDEIKWK